MPIVQIRYNRVSIPSEAVDALRQSLPVVAAEALTCEESIKYQPKHIMLEIEQMGALDVNCKSMNIRVWAHDYASRRSNLDAIRKKIANEVSRRLPDGADWYVWVLLVPSSYGSEAEELSFSS